MKALYVIKKGEPPPYIHNLQRLAELTNLELPETRRDRLIKITAFNIQSRYPDQKRSFRKKCTEEFTGIELSQIEEVFSWLKSML